VLARWPALAAIAVAAAAISGCASGGAATNDDAVGGELAVYSSLPLQGPSGLACEEIVNGEKLALAQAGGRAGRFKVGYVSLDDANPTTGRWDPGLTASNAKTAAQDTSTIAYLGDYESAATAISLPLINAAGIPQISPASPYVGLTSPLDAGQDEPERFYPSGQHTFARLQPGDPVQADAQLQLMHSLGIRSIYVLDDQDPFAIPLAELVAGDATAAGIRVVAHDSLSIVTGGTFKGEAEKIAESGAQAVFYSGEGSEGAAQMFRELHEADPRLMLLAPSSVVVEPFTAHLGTAQAATYLTTPVLPPSQYPPEGRRVLADYRRAFGTEGAGSALYGYESMSLLLDAIRRAGSHGNDRRAVIAQLLPTHERDSVLGRYAIESNGEPTLSRFAVLRLLGARTELYRVINASP
jgi:branched-chain amino acid transport system substrate-binding protein